MQPPRKQQDGMGLAWSVCWFVGGLSIVSPAKIAAPIEMPFELRTRVGPGNHVLDGGPDLLCKGAIWRGALPWAVQKRLNRSRFRFKCGLRCVQESTY